MRIVIAEDSTLLRTGLSLLLSENGHEVVEAIGDGEQLLRAAQAHRPDVAVIDVRMPPTFTDEGLRAALLIRRSLPETGVLVLSQWVEERYAADLISGTLSGVGYLLKDRVADVGDFLAALERVAAGGAVFDPDVVAQILARNRRSSPLATLTPREREVPQLMAEGRSNAGIGTMLTITKRAVEKYVGSILSKLDLPPAGADHRRVLAVLRYLESA